MNVCKLIFCLIFLALTGCGGGDSVSSGTSAGTTNNPNQPIADAGFGQRVATGAVVQLNGSASSTNSGKTLTYLWTLTSKPLGSKTTVVSSATATPSLVPDIVGTYVVALVVSDGALVSQPSSISLIAVHGSNAVIANAGSAQSVAALSTVRLNGSTSTGPVGSSLSYSWTLTSKPPGSKAVLTGEKTVTPSFVADVAGTFTATLLVIDSFGFSASSTVIITATAGALAPVANAGGAQSVLTGGTVQLIGTAINSSNGVSLRYQWTLSEKPAGSTAALSSTNVSNPSFVADISGTYIATLIVTSGTLTSDPVSVVIKASTGNAPPVANAGPTLTGFTGVKVPLDGSSSKSLSGSPLSYKWALTAQPPGSKAQLVSFEMVNSGFLPDLSGSYVATLIVNDGKQASEPSTVLINVAKSELTLRSIDRSGSPIQSWPFDNSSNPASMVGTVNCANGVCEDFAVATFQLQATGRTFTIANLAATNLTSNTGIAASVLGISDGQVLSNGQTVNVQLISQATNGQTVDLEYSFDIVETGDVFIFRVQLKTN